MVVPDATRWMVEEKSKGPILERLFILAPSCSDVTHREENLKLELSSLLPQHPYHSYTYTSSHIT